MSKYSSLIKLSVKTRAPPFITYKIANLATFSHVNSVASKLVLLKIYGVMLRHPLSNFI